MDAMVVEADENWFMHCYIVAAGSLDLGRKTCVLESKGFAAWAI